MAINIKKNYLGTDKILVLGKAKGHGDLPKIHQFPGSFVAE